MMWQDWLLRGGFPSIEFFCKNGETPEFRCTLSMRVDAAKVLISAGSGSSPQAAFEDAVVKGKKAVFE